GGMTVTAAANMSPSLFSAVVAPVPYVDLVEDLLDNSPGHLIGWRGEFGDPTRDAAALAALQMISPYDGIRPQCYPAGLISTDLQDSRVAFWGPLRYLARLRATMTGGGPVFANVSWLMGHTPPDMGLLAAAIVLTMRKHGMTAAAP